MSTLDSSNTCSRNLKLISSSQARGNPSIQIERQISGRRPEKCGQSGESYLPNYRRGWQQGDLGARHQVSDFIVIDLDISNA